MACKPMNKRNGLDTRQDLWIVIRRMGAFTVRELRNETVMNIDSVRDYVTGLAAAGYIIRLTCDEPAKYQLVNDIGVEAPRVRKDGTPVTQGQGRENMWNAMHIMRTFTARELAVQSRTPDCHIEESTAADYAKHLCKAGYLSKRSKGIYVMLPSAFTGPLAPMIQRTKRVWDPNQKKVRWRSDEGACDDK